MTARWRPFIFVIALAGAAAPALWTAGPSSGTSLFADTLYVQPDSVWKAEGEVFQIGIYVSAEVTGLMGYNVAVTFDSSVIEIVDVVEGPLLGTATDTTFFWWFGAGLESDSVHVNGAALGTTVDGPGELFTLTFKALVHGVVRTTEVRIVLSELRDGTNHPIVHERRHGFVAVEPTVRVEETTWGAIKERFR